MTDPFAHYGQHPDVNAALAAQEKIDRIQATRERDPGPDLRQAICDLAGVLSDLCASAIGEAIISGASREDMAHLRDMHERAEEIGRRLA